MLQLSRRLAPGALALLLVLPSVRAETIDGAFTDVDPDITPRFFHAASRLADGRVLVSGGLRVQILPPTLITLEQLSFLDPADGSYRATFVPAGGGAPVVPLLATARSSHTQTTLLDGRVLFAGGRTNASGTNPGLPVASTELFDPVTGLVTPGPAMSAPRAAHTATRLTDGRIVLAGGATWQVVAPDGAAIGPAFPLARSRTAHAAVLLTDHPVAGEDRVLLVGGAGSGPATLELVDPDAGTSALAAPELFVGVDDLAAVRLDDGTVLIVGGQDVTSGDTVFLTYRFDPPAGALALIAPPPGFAAGVADHELVAAGRFAFLFGGEQQVGGADTELDCAAVYDRVADAWTFAGTMNAVHDDFASVLLPDGRIALIDGGAPFFGQVVATDHTEVFAPSTLRPADLDGDGQVAFDDLLALLVAWGPCPPDAPCHADLDFDGAVGFQDLLIMLTAWGACA